MSKRKYRDYTKEELTKAVESSVSLSQVFLKLGLKPCGGNYDSLKRIIARHGLDTSHFTGMLWSKGKSVKDWANYKNNSGRKKFLILSRGHKCQACELTEWQNVPIPLELHHADGNRLNNEIENLEILCCNCHALTHNWRNKKRDSVAELVDAADLEKQLSAQREIFEVESSKLGKTLTDYADGNAEPSLRNKEGVESRRKTPKFCKQCEKDITFKKCSGFCSRECLKTFNRRNIPSKEDLLEAFKRHSSFLAVGRHFNVSDNAVRKWLKSYGLQDTVKAYSSARTKEI